MSVIDEIKDRIDPVSLIGETVKLRKTGKNHSGFCPFHPNSRTPAFVVFEDSGTWRCFGACNEGGDVFSFLMKKEGYDFQEALRVLAERAGVELKPRSAEQEAEEDAHQRLRELLEAAIIFYRHHLTQSAAGEPVLEYLHRRGLTDQTLEQFEIGYAPKSWDATMRYLIEKGYSDEELLKSGMVSERESGGCYDRYRHRIMIPIRDPSGRAVGFGARVVDPDDVPKFLNSPQTVLFDKGRLLYGLDRARKPIRSLDQAVIVEGYMDVIALHQAGFANVVSPMGTALSETQLRLLKRFSRHMILAMDADAAGDKAVLRGVDVARQAIDREYDPVFDARGLVRREGALDADIRVVTLPEGLDPDEVVEDDPQRWTELLQQARTVVDYVLDVLTIGEDLEDPKVKAEIAAEIMPLIDDVADSVERQTYMQRLARRLKVDERALAGYRPASRKGAPGQQPERAAAAAKPAAASDKVESFCLGLLLRDPELLYKVDRRLQSLNLDRLGASDYSESGHRFIFQAVRRALDQENEEPVRFLEQILQPPLDELADGLIAAVAAFEFVNENQVDEAVFSFLRLRQRSLEAAINQLKFQTMESDEEPEGELKNQRRLSLALESSKLGAQNDRIKAYILGRRQISRTQGAQ